MCQSWWKQKARSVHGLHNEERTSRSWVEPHGVWITIPAVDVFFSTKEITVDFMYLSAKVTQFVEITLYPHCKLDTVVMDE